MSDATQYKGLLDPMAPAPHRFLGEGSDVPAVVVGRDAEIATLLAAAEGAMPGTPTIVVMEGASGVGKSTLLRAGIAEIMAKDPGVMVAMGRCHERDTRSHNALESLIKGISMGSASVADIAEIGEPGDETHAIATGFACYLKRRAQGRRILLAIDNVQWGDLDSAKVLAEFLAVGEDLALMLIMSVRVEDEAPFVETLTDGMPSVTRIAVQGLSADATAHLAEALDIEDTAISKVVRASGGNPMLVELLAGTQGRSLSVDDAVRHAFSRCPTGSVRVLAILVISLGPISLQVIEHAAGLLEQREIMTMVQARLIRVIGVGNDRMFQLFHGRMRAPLHGLLVDRLQAARQALIAAYFATGAAVHDETIAALLVAAGNPDDARPYLDRAARTARQQGAHARALRLWNLMLEVCPAPPTDLHDRHEPVDLGTFLAGAGRVGAAAEQYKHWADRAVRPERANELRLQGLSLFLDAGMVPEALELANRIAGDLALPPVAIRSSMMMIYIRIFLIWWRARRPLPANPNSTPSPLKIRLYFALGRGLAWLEPDASAHYMLMATRMSLRIGDPELSAYGTAYAGGLLGYAGTPRLGRQALRMNERALRSPGGQRHLRTQTFGSLIEAMVKICAGDWVAGTQALDDIWRNSNIDPVTAWERNTARTTVLFSLFFVGDFQLLRRRAIEVEQYGVRCGNIGIRVEGLLHRSMAALVRDRPASTMALLAEVAPLLPTGNYLFQHWHMARFSAYASLYKADGEIDIAAFQAASDQSKKASLTDMVLVVIETSFIEATMLLYQAAHEGLRAIAGPKRWRFGGLRRRLRGHSAHYAQAYSECLNAGRAALAQRIPATEAALTAAQSEFRAAGMNTHALACALALGAEGAADELRALGIVRPERWARMLLPTLPVFREGPA